MLGAVIIVVASQSESSSLLFSLPADHLQRRLVLSGSRGLRQTRLHYQAMAVLHQHVAEKSQFRLLAFRLLVQAGVRIRGGSVRVVGVFLAAKAHAGIPRVRVARRGRRAGARLETLLSRPSFDQASSAR